MLGDVENFISTRRQVSQVPAFLLSSAARSFSLMALCQLSDEDAYNMFRPLRWPDNDSAPVCLRRRRKGRIGRGWCELMKVCRGKRRKRWG